MRARRACGRCGPPTTPRMSCPQPVHRPSRSRLWPVAQPRHTWQTPRSTLARPGCAWQSILLRDGNRESARWRSGARAGQGSGIGTDQGSVTRGFVWLRRAPAYIQNNPARCNVSKASQFTQVYCLLDSNDSKEMLSVCTHVFILARLLALLCQPCFGGRVVPEVALETDQRNLDPRTQLDDLLDPLGLDVLQRSRIVNLRRSEPGVNEARWQTSERQVELTEKHRRITCVSV